MSPALFWTKLPADHALAAAVYTARANARRDAGDATEAARLDEAAEANAERARLRSTARPA
jgi:hypothetical protein